jgi:hypothetical protein
LHLLRNLSFGLQEQETVISNPLPYLEYQENPGSRTRLPWTEDAICVHLLTFQMTASEAHLHTLLLKTTTRGITQQPRYSTIVNIADSETSQNLRLYQPRHASLLHCDAMSKQHKYLIPRNEPPVTLRTPATLQLTESSPIMRRRLLPTIVNPLESGI